MATPQFPYKWQAQFFDNSQETNGDVAAFAATCSLTAIWAFVDAQLNEYNNTQTTSAPFTAKVWEVQGDVEVTR